MIVALKGEDIMMQSQDRFQELVSLRKRRKQGDLTILEYYHGLLQITASLLINLQDEDISEGEAKRQIPLILVFLEEQIAKLNRRGG